MNFSKNLLLFLSTFFFSFVSIHCSEIPSSFYENNKMIVKSDCHNGPYLPDNFFGSFKLIRPLPKPSIKFYVCYDHIMILVPFSYALSSLVNDPTPWLVTCVTLLLYMAFLYFPNLFGLRWVASLESTEGFTNGPIKIAAAPIDEIFLAEGSVSHDPELCFQLFLRIYRYMTKKYTKFIKSRRFRQ